MEIDVLDDSSAQGSGWRFRHGGESITISTAGVLIDGPPIERQIRQGDRVAYWDDLLIEATDWLARETGLAALSLPDGAQYDLSLLGLGRTPLSRGLRPTGSPPTRVDWRTMLLAHHLPEKYDRCARIGRFHICRRCLVLYPLAIVAAIATLTLVNERPGFDATLLWLVPIPATIEFVGEQLGWWKYSKWRQSAVMVPMALAFGWGLGRYIDSPGDRLFWAVLLVNCAVWGTAAVLGHRQRERAELFEPGSV